jgi:hypothetical protein
MPLWARVLIVFGIVATACVTLLWLFGTQAFLALEARAAARKLPFVAQAPTELPDLSISREPGTKLTYFGYEFEIPWADIDQQKTKTIGMNKAIVAFQSGNAISLWSGPPHELMKRVMDEMKMDTDAFGKIYGDEAVKSDYSFERTILETTPDRISVFSVRRTAASRGILLMVKALSTPGDPNTGIFEVRTNEFKGFQYGSPNGPSRRVSVELFPENGHLDLLFFPKENGPTPISQADINRVVQTLHKLPEGAASSVDRRATGVVSEIPTP